LNAVELADLTSASLSVYDGSTLVKELSSTSPDEKGIFWFTWNSTGLQPGKTYFVKATVVFRNGTYNSGQSIDVTFAKRQLDQRNQLTALESKAAEIKTKTDVIEQKVETSKAEIKADTAKILTATETTLPAQITETKERVETGMKSEILNREPTIRSGQSMIVRFRTYDGLKPEIDVYNQKGLQVLTKGKMNEIGKTGIYEYEVKFLGGWGKGDFTIVCSESTKNVMDAFILSVIRTDVEQVAGQVSAVLGTTTSLTGLKDVANTLNSQFSVIESALGKISKELVDQVKDVASSATDIESVYKQLVSVGRELNKMSKNQEVNLQKLVEVSQEKKQDMMYLKNKTQEMKAVLEINNKLMDNMANKPVTQTWFEFK
jgi:hypothetical protein